MFWVSFFGKARNAIIFLDGDSMFHMFFSRNLILRTMSFAILINSKNSIKKIKQPGIVEDNDLHEYVYIGREPLNCYHYKNTHNIAYKHIAKAVVDTYFHDKLEETIVIFTTNNWTLEEELQHCLYNKWKTCTINFDRKQLKAEGKEQELENNITAALKRTNLILILNIVKKGFQFHKDHLPLSLDDASNVVVLLESEKTFGDHKKASEYYVSKGWEYFYDNDDETSMKRFNQAWLLDNTNSQIYWGFGNLLGKSKKN